MSWDMDVKFMDVKLVKIPTLAALQVAESIWEMWSNVREPSKNRTYVAKKKFSVPILLYPKAVTDAKNSLR